MGLHLRPKPSISWKGHGVYTMLTFFFCSLINVNNSFNYRSVTMMNDQMLCHEGPCLILGQEFYTRLSSCLVYQIRVVKSITHDEVVHRNLDLPRVNSSRTIFSQEVGLPWMKANFTKIR